MRPLLIIGGVSGCGKTTLAAALAAALALPWCDGDDLHPPSNKAKMAAGVPLDDADRAPWLSACAAQLSTWGQAGSGGVLGASALKRAYRKGLYAAHPGVIYVLIDITPERAIERIAARAATQLNHFWPASLTASQFAILECPGSDEPALCVDAEWATHRQVDTICAAVGMITPF